MNCPDCTNQMAERTVMGVTVDECESCRAVWFERDELAPYLRRIRSTPDRPVPSDEKFRIANVGEPSPCPKCGGSGFRFGVFRAVPFGACRNCSGLFFQESSIQQILDTQNPRDWDPKQTVKEPSLLDALLWALMMGDFFYIFMYQFWDLWPDVSNSDGT